MDKELEHILNEIKRKDFTFRNIIDGQNHIIWDAYIDNASKYNDIVGFLIYARTVKLFDFSNAKDANDISIGIHQSTHPNKEKIQALWEDIKDNYPYLDQLLPVLAECALDRYVDSEQDIAKWVNRNYLADARGLDQRLFGNTKRWTFDIIFACQEQLGVDVRHGSILFSIDPSCCLDILGHAQSMEKITICSQKIDNVLKINVFLLDCFSNITFVQNENNEVFPFEDAKFDVVVCERAGEAKESDDVLHYVKDGGVCIAFDQKANVVSDSFYQYQIPLVVDVLGGSSKGEDHAVVYKKVADDEERVPYAFVSDDGSEGKWITKTLIDCIHHKITNNNIFQDLTKDDFRLSDKSLSFFDLQRPQGEDDFVWEDINNIIEPLPDGDWVNEDFDSAKLVSQSDLSDNPFRVNLPEEKYIKEYSNKAIKHHPLQLCWIEAARYNPSWSIDNKYKDLFFNAYSNAGKLTSEAKLFDKMLCCRVLRAPALLYNGHTILRVKATKNDAVCYTRYEFFQEGGDFVCWSPMNPVKIKEGYDEDFVIYQLLKGTRNHHILVAPSKEEQHSFFLSKRRDYIANFIPALDEIEDETRDRFANISSRINGIGFHNFRRFADFMNLPLGGVNILVGANNAGKSTFVKGLLLAIDNIKSLKVEYADNIFKSGMRPMFRLDSNNYPNVHVGKFSRALSWSSDHKEIDFKLCISSYEIRMSIGQEDESETSAIPITRIHVIDNYRKTSFDIDYLKKEVSVKIDTADKKIEYTTQLSIAQDRVGSLLIPQLIRGIAIDAENIKSDNSEAKRLRVWSSFLYEIADELEGIINNTTVEYIYAHGISQRALFDYNDRNDYMAMTLHDLINEKIGKEERNFINRWLEKFGIGVDYEVSSVVGESYILRIKDKDKHMTCLADMGMGANQLATLLFRLAIFIHKQRMLGNSPYKPTIVIEEPEQNMHPAFQSLLADLFFEVEQKYGFCFIVETHSEYLVRRTQVIVAGQYYKDERELEARNPFNVYYFPSDKNPYDMKFRPDGNFKEEFGPGFYDEATNLLFQII